MNDTEPCTNVIRIRGARTHNLQDVDVDLPLGRLIVMTGVSGSGKSSLAFDTLFAEGQRRYLESVSVHTRSLLKELTRPDVDEVSGLPPTVSVDQRVGTVPARSTLAVTTEIHDYLRLLYARAGTAHCTNCGNPVESQTVDQIVDRALRLPPRTKLMILSPMVRGRKGAHKDVFERIARNGFVRVRIDGEQCDIADVPQLATAQEHTIDAIIDRIIVKEGIEPRLRESIQLAVRESDGTCLVCEQTDTGWQDRLFSTKFCCPDCDLSFPTPEPRTFSFNSAWGACPECSGFGVRGVVDDSADVTVFRQARCPACHGSRLQPFASAVTFLGLTMADVTSMSIDAALDWLNSLARTLLRRTDDVHGEAAGEECPPTDALRRPPSAGDQCGVARNSEPRTSSVGTLTSEALLVARRTLPDILQRLTCLHQVGLGYLTLDRPTRTLSGGEFQRARLSACLGTGLHGACFVLDEPTAGLHPRDTRRLLRTLFDIRDSGATVVVVEHDGDVMRSADWLVDLGPGAGQDGGRLLFAGPPKEAVSSSTDTPTTLYLRAEATRSPRLAANPVDHDAQAGDLNDARPSGTTPTQQSLFPDEACDDTLRKITIRNASLHNLQDVTVDIPLGKLVCVTGVSGSGKTSLIMETLLPVAGAARRDDVDTATVLADVRCEAVEGLEWIRRVVAVDHSPLGRNRRSSIATYSGLWDRIRKILARTRDARARGFAAKRFSFNTGDGRCSECRGTGVKDVRMSFLPDVTVPCPGCRGRRFNQATLGVRFAGLTAADILDLRVDRAIAVFREFETLRTPLQTFQDVGLGYLTLGQPASTFSGGESQRVRLATELAARHDEPTLYILDEPTSGLHPADIDRLLTVLRALVANGHSVIVIEHNTDVMRSSDWLIDVGPDSADQGGEITFSGHIADAILSSGFTAAALRGETD